MNPILRLTLGLVVTLVLLRTIRVGAQETSRVIPFNNVVTTLSPSTVQDVTVQLWDVAGGGKSPLFSEAQPGLVVDINGNINFVFGSLSPGPPAGLDPSNFPSGSSRFIDVVDGIGNSVLVNGRLPLNATPFVLSPGPAGALPFVTVSADGTGDFTDLQSAINSLGSAGGRIVVKAGTYQVGSTGIRFSSNNITIEGAGPATRFFFNADSLSTCFAMADTTQRVNIRLSNFRISQQGMPGRGVAIDFSHFAQSLFQNITVDGVNGGFIGNASGTLYNRFYNCTATVSGQDAYGFKLDNASNENSFYSCRSIGDSNTTGFVVNAHATKLFDPDAESRQAIGIDIQSSGNDCLVVGPYLEANVINIQFASGVQSPTIIGGVSIEATGSNINNLGAKGLNIYNLRLQHLRTAYQPFTHRESQSGMPSQRWIKPYFYTLNASSQPATGGRVYLLESELTEDAIIDGVSYIIGSSIGGNLTVGLYGPISNEETCDGAPLVVQSESTPQAGTVNQDQLVLLDASLAHAGRYYVAIEFDGAASTYNRNPNLVDVTGWSQFFDRPGGYGALPSRCPAVTNSGSAFPLVKIRLGTLTTL